MQAQQVVEQYQHGFLEVNGQRLFPVMTLSGDSYLPRYICFLKSPTKKPATHDENSSVGRDGDVRIFPGYMTHAVEFTYWDDPETVKSKLDKAAAWLKENA